MPRLFATVQQVRDYSGDQSIELTQRQLAAGSALVARATRFARYDLAGDGTASDSAVEAALRSATCEVLAHRNDAGVLSPVSLADLGLASASLGSASYTVSAGGSGKSYQLMPWDAYLILDAAGLLRPAPEVVG